LDRLGFRSLVRGVSNYGGLYVLRDGRHATIASDESVGVRALLRTRRVDGPGLSSRFISSETP